MRLKNRLATTRRIQNSTNKLRRRRTESLFFGIDSRPYGLAYGEWTAKWWQWLLSIPRDVNPAVDDTGKNASVNQVDSNVWFLAGTLSSRGVERTCRIPAGKAILFPITTHEWSFAEDPSLQSDLALLANAKEDQDKVANTEATIDGVKLRKIDKCRVGSSVFDIILPKNNILGVKAGPSRAASDGYWVFLKALNGKGNHTIHFIGYEPDLHIDVTYIIRMR